MKKENGRRIDWACCAIKDLLSGRERDSIQGSRRRHLNLLEESFMICKRQEELLEWLLKLWVGAADNEEAI